MIESISLIWSFVLPFLVVLTVLVFVHEMGHYVAARVCGIRVEVFSIGFGREIFGWTDRAGTRWRLSWIPFGGYVKMFGEMLAVKREENKTASSASMTREEEAVAFNTKSVGQRAFVVAAGPAANFLLAIVILSGMFMSVGQQFTPADVGTVIPGKAADRAGFKPGDIILGIDGSRIQRFEQLAQTVRLYPGVPLEFTVSRDGIELTLVATPDVIEEEGRFGFQRYGQLGISRTGLDREFIIHGPVTAIWRATEETYVLASSILAALGQIISGTRTTKEIGGPIRIAQMSGDVWAAGLVSLLMFATVLSINLGLINLFPVPMLDGGHLMFYAIEALRGRPLGERAQENGMKIGLTMVLGLMVFATWNDLVQLRIVNFFINLVT
ncbi:MAG: RIP metalloprotease RseP [Pseudomonadota bacterium]|nr:RIP metalloprotease RseP [Pseudomonadota bacterium]